MSLANPGRVGDAVTHGAATATIALGVAAAVVAGAAIAFFAWPFIVAAAGELAITAGVAAVLGVEAGTATTIVAAGTAVSLTGVAESAGAWIGKHVDAVCADTVAGHLVTGFPTVLLGPSVKEAARAAEDTKADCHSEAVGWEGSSTVSLGEKPMSRVADHLKCQGKIMEGLTTVHVGGDPVHEGKDLEEEPNAIVWWLGIGSDVSAFGGVTGWYSLGFAAVGLGLDLFHPGWLADRYNEGTTGFGIKTTVDILRGK